LSVEAFAEDCARAAVVVSPREAPGACNALLIDRRSWRANGALALRWTIDRFALIPAKAGIQNVWLWVPAFAGTNGSEINTAETARPACPGCVPGWAAGCAPRR